MDNPKGTVIVTGGAKRLGAAMARYLAGKGYDLILHYLTASDQMVDLKKKLSVFPVRVSALKWDLRKHPRRFMAACLKKSPRLAGLINNASLFLPGNFSNPGNFISQLSVNTWAPLHLSDEFYRGTETEAFIVNLIDAHVHRYDETFQNYRFSKTILQEITRQSALLYAPRVRVNGIAPGPILTAINDIPERFQKQVARTPLKRSPGVEGVIRCLDFLIHSSFSTGQILYADSGLHLY